MCIQCEIAVADTECLLCAMPLCEECGDHYGGLCEPCIVEDSLQLDE